MENDDLARRRIEEAEEKALLEKIARENKTEFSSEQQERIQSINIKISELNSKKEEAERKLRTDKTEYEILLKKENLKPIVVPFVSAFAFIGTVLLLFVLFFKKIFEQALFLQYSWLICYGAMLLLLLATKLYTNSCERKRRPLMREMTELEKRIESDDREINDLQNKKNRL